MAVIRIKKFKFTSKSFMIIMGMDMEGSSFLGPSERIGTMHPFIMAISSCPNPTKQWSFEPSTSIGHKLIYLSTIPKLGCLPDKLVTQKQDIFNTIVSSLVTNDLLERHGSTISFVMELIRDVIDIQSNQQRLIEEISISDRPSLDQAFVVFSPFIRSFDSPRLIDCFNRLENNINKNDLIKLMDIDLFIQVSDWIVMIGQLITQPN
ncbi:hypothetical protein SAMD00019534_040930 [Acytostelium subglobosum LB1]|uniref:hypothetical protein n=1 Tax=Acytostelium subglobosum LB1 TaxID=1410327 RepID=UPI0006449717|nr:hypothetical protein SAMD00019534_040930 [Acytostelium subglobosum LB1]GAM20918.1 hypothetical protein SAMD00019534_040930 [Acytostelium subglobosum LB1]|eukprot:XP_012756052.1 hypothetical protein SAMD00019534_040930 [Acytostelium subglobosum LB1]